MKIKDTLSKDIYNNLAKRVVYKEENHTRIPREESP